MQTSPVLKWIPVILIVVMLVAPLSCEREKHQIIAFTGSPAGDRWNYVYSMDTDGSNITQLAQIHLPAALPYRMWSSDGRRLAFTEYIEEDTFHLCVIDADGQNKKQLFEIEAYDRFTFSMSPDGRTVAFSKEVTRRTETPMYGSVHVEITANTDLFLLDIASGEIIRLTDTEDIWESHPTISPNGENIAYAVRIDTENKKNVTEYLYLMDIDGSNKREFAYHPEALMMDFLPDLRWSPDSKIIAYSILNHSISDSEHFSDIYAVNIENMIVTNLTESPLISDTNPAWSPDSRRIAYSSGTPEEGFFIWLMDPDGNNKEQLYQSSAPCWTPDGKGIIFTNRSNKNEIMVIDPDGSNPRSLLEIEDLRIGNPIWLSD